MVVIQVPHDLSDRLVFATSSVLYHIFLQMARAKNASVTLEIKKI